MPTTALTELREKERFEELRQFLTAASSWLSLPLFLIFWVADIIYAPQLMWEFLAYRMGIIPVCLLTRRVARRVRILRDLQITASMYILANSLIITVLVARLEGAGSPYYAGLNLVAMGIVYFPWSGTFLYLNILFVYGPYVLLSLFQISRGAGSPSFLLSMFFVGGTLVISMFIRYSMESLRLKELQSRAQLEDELRSREKIIREKTGEAVRLTQLASQFSPQVVHGIRSGDIDIMSILHRVNICTIFVDIVDSTNHIVRMEMERFNEVISMFVEDVTDVLLKYDITIDKFLGDGVLGFANAPVRRPDYVTRVADAALEIRHRIQGRAQYVELLGSPLRIRVGVASGDAHVGFFGSDRSVKSYTAIGKVVNLAARLCSAARADEILVSSEVAESLPSDGYVVQQRRVKSLKGFQTVDLRVFELVQLRTERNQDDEISLCPKGHGVLHLETNKSGIYVLRCRACGYEASDMDSDEDDKIRRVA